MSQATAYHACMITPNDTYIHGFSHMSSQELFMHSSVSAYNYTVTHITSCSEIQSTIDVFSSQLNVRNTYKSEHADCQWLLNLSIYICNALSSTNHMQLTFPVVTRAGKFNCRQEVCGFKRNISHA